MKQQNKITLPRAKAAQPAKKLSARCTPELKKRLRAACKSLRCSQNEFVCSALSEFTAKRPTPPKRTVTVQFTDAQFARLQSAVSFLGRGVTVEKLARSGALGVLDGWGTSGKEARSLLRRAVATYAKGTAYARPEDGINLPDGVQHEGNWRKGKAA